MRTLKARWTTARTIRDDHGEPYADIEVCAEEEPGRQTCDEGSWWTLADAALGRRAGHQYVLCAPFSTMRVWCRSEAAAGFAGRLGVGTRATRPEQRTLVGHAARYGLTVPVVRGVPVHDAGTPSLWTGDEGRFWEQMAGWPGTGRRGAVWPDPRASEVDAFAEREGRDRPRIALPPTPGLPRAIPRSSHGFTDDPIGLEQLSRWLARFARIRSSTRAAAPDATYAIIERGMPQGGALRTTELWLALRAVTGVSPGLYRYDEASHALEHRADTVVSLIEEAKTALGRGGGTPAGVTIVCARMKPLLAKYAGIALSIAITNAGVCLGAAQAAAAHEAMVVRGLGSIPARAWLELSAEDPRRVCPLAAFAIGRNPSQLDTTTRVERDQWEWKAPAAQATASRD